MKWSEDGWPLIGADPDGDGKGEPVAVHKKPTVTEAGRGSTPATSDEFSTQQLGLQWQWNANPAADWASLAAQEGFLRLRCVPAPALNSLDLPAGANVYDCPNLLLQKFPAPEFSATTRMKFEPGTEGEQAGLVVFGLDYALLALRRNHGQTRLVFVTCRDAHLPASQEEERNSIPWDDSEIELRVTVDASAWCTFSYRKTNGAFTPFGPAFKAKVDRWVGAKLGLLATAASGTTQTNWASFDWFRVTPPARR
jgi:beta-xylosidase